jgi:hypothetical protein
VGEKEDEWFERTKGVRQGCLLSPLRVTIYVADMDGILKKAPESLKPGICGLLGNCGKAGKRNDEEPGKVCEKEKPGSECREDENDAVQ